MTWELIETAKQDGRKLLLAKRRSGTGAWMIWVGSWSNRTRIPRWMPYPATSRYLDPTHWSFITPPKATGIKNV